MLLINFWQVLIFLIAFLSLKQAKNEGKLDIVHEKARLKLNYTNNQSLGELRSLCQINQVCKEENQRRNITFMNFITPCEIFISLQIAQEGILQALRNWGWILQPLAKFSQSCEIFATLQNLPKIFKYFCTDSVRFLSQDILCNYLFSPCNKLKIFLDI